MILVRAPISASTLPAPCACARHGASIRAASRAARLCAVDIGADITQARINDDGGHRGGAIAFASSVVTVSTRWTRRGSHNGEMTPIPTPSILGEPLGFPDSTADSAGST